LNIWLAAGAVVALVLIAAVVVGVRRPRSAEDELGQAEPRPAPIGVDSIDTRGTVKQVLQAIQKGRETGTLVLTAGERTGSLYFLFGHLFHAVCGAATGEIALQDVLGWSDVRYAFDKKSPLPTEETIERPLDQILA
jgi:hypothetical protein